MEQLKSNILCFFCLIVVAGSFTSCKEKQREPEAKSIAVEIQKISYNSSAYNEEYIGTVESENTVDVSFLTMGTIERMYATEGQRISKGQLLASLNMASLKSTHDLAVAALKQAEDAYKRMTAMYESKSLPEIQYIDYRTKLEQAKSGEAIAQKNLKDGNLYAPQSGAVSVKYLEPGANVMPGTPVYQLMDIAEVKVKTAIPEGEISNYRTGMACMVNISALNNETFSGQIVEKGVTANAVSHTYDVMVKINNPGGRIMPGMVCKVYPLTAGTTAVIVVPLKAVQVDFSGKRFVWLRDSQGKAKYKQVTLGALTGDGVVITSGLNEDDELITAGYQNISEGINVSVQQK
ncbi:efflux RND transporter periplasmic adaptor subunit [Sphingobacterium lactis]|uniref:efflux RND transporter periplasmic adaptor subunit n=1 Tax=Sphingobacterium TaxID=28453 RepID=UPI0028996B10|nr:efflux RND transporter periplasmic adaptor subunit [Sphingobacterium sp.]